MAGHAALDRRMVVRIHRGQLSVTAPLINSLQSLSLQGFGMDGLSVPVHTFRVLTGTGNPALAKEIAEHLDVDLCKCTVSRFADGEVFVRIDENVRGADVFIMQPTNRSEERRVGKEC